MAAFRVTTIPIHHLCCLFLFIMFGSQMTTLAQVQTRITSDGSLGTTVVQNESVHTIDGGTIQGSNQYHSFDRFDVGTGDIANFTGPATVEHILSRVTGGVASRIDGTLQSDIAGANLYLLNPSGLMFGPNAQLDIMGSFHVSTADVLHLEDGGVFAVDRGRERVLSVADPIAFGFLSNNPSGIRIEESILVVPSGQRLSVVGGDIDIIGGRSGFVQALSGQIGITSVTSSGHVAFDHTDLASTTGLEDAMLNGTIVLSELAFLNVSGEIGGAIQIRGGVIEIKGGSVIIANTVGEAMRGPGGIVIEASDTLRLTEGSRIISETVGRGTAGSVDITARHIEVQDRSVISTATFGAGQGGGVTLQATDRVILDQSAIFATSEGLSGQAGNVLLEAPVVSIANDARIVTDTQGSGRGGSVTIRATNMISIANSTSDDRVAGAIFADTRGSGPAGSVWVEAPVVQLEGGGAIFSRAFGAGQGGQVTILANQVSIAGASTDGVSPSVIAVATVGRAANSGPAGSLLIESAVLRLDDGGLINASTFGPGPGGDITIRATEAVIIENSSVFAQAEGIAQNSGSAGRIAIEAPVVRLENRADISSASVGPGSSGMVSIHATETVGVDNSVLTVQASGRSANAGPAGSILIESAVLTLSNDALIISSTFGTGEGGEITIRSTDTVVLNNSNIITQAIDVADSGNAGTILVESPVVRLENGGRIDNSTFGTGQGGPLTVRATKQLSITGMSPNGFPSVLSSTTESDDARAGHTGSILIEAGVVELSEGGQIVISSQGPGQSGDVMIRATDRVLITGSAPTSAILSTSEGESLRAGNAGSIRIEAPVIQVDDGAQITSSTFGPGQAGTVTLRATETIAFTNRGAIAAQALGFSAGSGRAGAVLVEASVVMFADGGQITSSTFGPGHGGTVTIRATEIVLLDDGDIFARTFGTAAGSGRAGSILVEAPAIRLLRGSRMTSSTLGSGRGGMVTIRANNTVTLDDALILTSTEDRGTGGTINVEAQQIELTSGSRLESESTGVGNAGNIILTASKTLRSNNSTITTEATQANGGNIIIKAQTLVQQNDSVISAEVGTEGGRGVGGDIDIEGNTIELTEGARITTESGGEGNAGNMNINARQMLLIDQSEVTTSASQADGGDVKITADFIELRDGRIVTAVGSGDGGGGNIAVTVNLGLLESSEIRADAFGGPGGRITIRSNGFITDTNTVISASSEQNVDGTVDIQGLDDLSGSLTAIDPDFASNTALRTNQCARRLLGEGISRFTRAGRDRIPTEPDGLLPSSSARATVADVALRARQQATLLSQGQPRLTPTLAAWHRYCAR